MEIVEVFDECLEQVLAGQQTVEDCLARYPELKDELESLLAVALAVHRAAPASLPPLAASRIRNNLESKMLNGRPESGPRLRLLQSTIAKLAAAVIVALFIGGGAVVAAASSLPDAPLYPIKQAVEQVQLLITPDAEGQARLYLEFAERRLQEAESISSTATIQNRPVIESLGNETEQVLARIDSLPETKKASLAEKIIDLEERQQQVLTEVLAKAPEAAQPGIENALERSKRGHERAAEMLEDNRKSTVKPSRSTKRDSEGARHELSPTPTVASTPITRPTANSVKVDDDRVGKSERHGEDEDERPANPTFIPAIDAPIIASPVPTLISAPTWSENRSDDDKTRDRDKSRNSDPTATPSPTPRAMPASQATSTPTKGDQDKEKERDRRGNNDTKGRPEDEQAGSESLNSSILNSQHLRLGQ